MRKGLVQLPRFAVRASLGVLALGVLAFAGAAISAAQTPQGATLTIQAGQVGVLRLDGSAAQPAPSGMILSVGTQVATIGQSEALLTFFEGTELDLGWNTTIVIREIVTQGQEVHVTVEDVFGSTVSRITGFVNPNSSYKIQNPKGQVVALVRGSVATMLVTGDGTLVGCDGDCAVHVDGKELCNSKREDCDIGVDKDGGVTRGKSLPSPAVETQKNEDKKDDSPFR